MAANTETGMIGQRHRWQWWHFSLLAAIVLLALVPLDIPLARLTYSHPLSPVAMRTVEFLGNVAGGGVGVVILVAIAVLIDRRRWRRLPLLISSALGAGLMVDIIKLCVYRSRPHSTDLLTATFASTFHGWFPVFSAGNAGQSFPSGHAATAAGLAVGLAMFYPRWRWLFLLPAAGVAIARVVVHAHFPTDVAAGAMLGVAWGWNCHHGFLAPVYARSEQLLDKLAQRFGRGRTNVASRSANLNSTSASSGASNRDSDRRNVA